QQYIKGTGAKVAVVEMPPGPPVLQSVVAEVHGPSPEVRRQFARDLTAIFSQAESLRDVDNYMREPSEYWRFEVDTEKAVRRGISVDAINRNLSMALGGMVLGDVKQRAGHEPVNIVIQVPLAERSQVARLGDLPIQSQAGVTLPLRELGRFERIQEEEIIFHKDLRPVEYVVADVGGELAAPVYGMFQVQDLLAEKDYVAPDGVKLHEGGMVEDGYHWFSPPADDTKTSFEWTGEWTVTFETFRDMGAAFMVALVLIYILVVWEFGNFRIPALIMAPIPLTLLGIIPMHAIMGAEFTATSMIGWIALAGIIVRNSILLVDFSIHEIQRGTPVAEAVIRSCKTRTRPIMITALALVCGSSVIFTDPIFQGMAISLASGVMVSTILTLIVIPLGCIKASKSLCEVAAAGAADPSLIQFPEAQEKVEEQPAVPKPPLLLTIWAKVAGGLMMLFYAVRGIFLLLGQMFARKRAAPPPPPPPPPASATPPVAAPVSEAKSEPEEKAPAAPAEAKAEVVAEEKPAAEPEKVVTEAAPKTVEAVKAEPKAAPAKKKTVKKAAAKKVVKKSVAKKTAAKKAAANKAAAKKEVAKKPPVAKKPVIKKAAAKKKVVKKQVAKKAPAKPAEQPKPAEKPAAAKKGGRRGIRLKVNSGDGLA
ncbi:MAG: efflux RND transporter permease subunit, partial [Sedimenticola sp.]